VALLALEPSYLKKYDIPLSAIRGVASISGVFDVSKIGGFPAADGAANPSPVRHVHSGAPPFLVSYCQWDYLALPLQAREFADALKKAFDPVELLYVPGQGHISEIIHIVQDDDVIAQSIIKMIQ
jgi:acetyl esterase/lipase